MRLTLLMVGLAVAACRDAAPPQKPPSVQSTARAPVALVGTWVQERTASIGSDTLLLRADSTASGRLPGFPAGRATRWKMMFTSRSPVVDRSDWYGGHPDGGDLVCTTDSAAAGCISNPVLCIGDERAYRCVGFRFRHDTLALSSGDIYLRRAGRPSTPPER
jgi:hypothetical protein